MNIITKLYFQTPGIIKPFYKLQRKHDEFCTSLPLGKNFSLYMVEVGEKY